MQFLKKAVALGFQTIIAAEREKEFRIIIALVV